MKKSYKESFQEISSSCKAIPIEGELLIQFQTVLGKALKEIDDVCRKNNITMYLCGGTLLGAVRHKGFIPWDDDVDVAMSREDFERFKLIFDVELGEKFTLNCPNYKGNSITRFPKVLLKGTKMQTLTSQEDEEMFIDIFTFENCPKNIIHRYIHGIYCQFLIAISSCVYVYKHDNGTVRKLVNQTKEVYRAYKRRLMIGRLFSYRSLDCWFNRVDNACNYRKKTGLICFPCGRKHFFGEILDSSIFEGKNEIQFGEYLFYAPQKCDEYLTNLYGDYMQIPPVEKRETHMIKKIDFGTWLVE